MMDGQHRKFLKDLIWFIPFLLVVYVIMTLVFGEWVDPKYRKNLAYIKGSGGHVNTRLKDAGRTKNVDVLFLGSSHTYRGFDTRIFEKQGFSCFNLGSSSQTPIQTELLLNRYLQNLEPKIIVFEVYPEMFCVDGVESSLDILANDENDLGSLIMALQQNNIRVYNTLLFSYYSDLLGRNESFKEELVRSKDTYIKGGFVEKEMKHFREEKYPMNTWKFNENQFQAFERILKSVQKRKVRILLVQAPITKGLYTSYTNNQQFDQRMSKYGNYVNFNGKLPLDDSLHFYDKHHLNQRGVELFDQAVLQILKLK